MVNLTIVFISLRSWASSKAKQPLSHQGRRLWDEKQVDVLLFDILLSKSGSHIFTLIKDSFLLYVSLPSHLKVQRHIWQPEDWIGFSPTHTFSVLRQSYWLSRTIKRTNVTLFYFSRHCGGRASWLKKNMLMLTFESSLYPTLFQFILG